MMVAGVNWREWLRQAWPTKRRLVVADALTIGQQHRHFLADLAMRGNVFAPIVTSDPIEAHRQEGRRQLAIETLKLCQLDPLLAWSLIEDKPSQTKGAAT